MDRDELSAWLRLTLAPGIGRALARRLLRHCGSSVQALFEQSPADLGALLNPAQRAALLAVSPAQRAAIDTCWQWLQAPPPGLAHAVVAMGDPRYPASLLATEDPPLLLYVAGPASAFAPGQALFPQQRALAMVGSRHPSAQGLLDAERLAHELGAAGLCIVSGMALGIDGAAHAGALRAARAPDAGPATIAVWGTGLDQPYPRRHAALAQRIVRAGLLVSEYPLGTPPLAAHFPQRNRIIAGLAQGTLVVEAALASGSLITARLAAEQGREVFAIPGSIHAPQSQGCHALLRQGAKLVETAQDVLEELQGLAPQRPAPAKAPAGPPETAAERTLLAALGYDPLGLDELVARTGWSAAQLQAALLELELAGRVARLAGGVFQRMERG
ncbi:DNA-processing protein DprA [Comamonas endophytica]|uniref:DNA-processing protein DprA n=1 Tax=Comamonas endophytica TaxID=2949090 RepID=A0ABY6GDX3_9BURK|nr:MULTISPECIES: DNA-processing protein DprA [unclassified Acidovorax]MCD2512334.1 DNA-processing protein DprA [Acidovorax sp. D4N7]UYG53294.1 DNA-processing protein DprA [Acidovorax sp. 5MLIR]